jgi:hypothetical protein
MQPSLASGYLRDQPGQIDLSSLKCEYWLGIFVNLLTQRKEYQIGTTREFLGI